MAVPTDEAAQSIAVVHDYSFFLTPEPVAALNVPGAIGADVTTDARQVILGLGDATVVFEPLREDSRETRDVAIRLSAALERVAVLLSGHAIRERVAAGCDMDQHMRLAPHDWHP